ncbi:Disease resistance protein RPM1 [Hordeum vulgare]|nr:Disease resistance protein RPM1 [Hordeum vulgare]
MRHNQFSARAKTPSRAIYLLCPLPRTAYSSARSQLHLPRTAAAPPPPAPPHFFRRPFRRFPGLSPASPLLPPSLSSHRRPSRAAAVRRTAPAHPLPLGARKVFKRFWDQKMLWYIMYACVIMHNMIIENERGQDLDYSQYELLGYPVRVRQKAERVARFVVFYQPFDVPKRILIFRRISLRNGGHGMTVKEHHDLCICCCIVELFVVLKKYYLFEL